MLYLVYQDAKKNPVAVFTEDRDSFVDPNYQGSISRLKEMAFDTRGPLRSWSDWAQTLSEKTPSRQGQWNAVNRRTQALPVLLAALQKSMRTE